MTSPGLAEIEQALIDLVQADTALKTYVKTVETLGDRNIDPNTLEFIVSPPAVLFLLTSAELASATLDRKTYRWRPRWAVIAVAQNLRGPAQAKRGGPVAEEVGVYDMLDDLKNCLAGARLSLPSGGNTIVTLAGEGLESYGQKRAAYYLEIVVETDYQA